jgi:FAD/FMN-containing dehydrogenase
VLDHTPRNKIISFHPEQAIITAQAGVSLADILRVIVPAGFFLPVSPGTQFVTLGGALAADVHGKNHHVDGSIGQYVPSFLLQTATGQQLVCSLQQNTDIYDATQGGMGLTGAIEEITLRLLPIESDQIQVVAHRTRDLEETLGQLEATAHLHRYSVSWIDPLASGTSLGRGWVLAGDHAPRSSPLPLAWKSRSVASVPFFLPSGVLSPTTCRWFNNRIYRKGIVQTDRVSLESFFYPLDRVRHWNRLYGRRGFIEYQAVLPRPTAHATLRRMLEAIAYSGIPAFFAGIKSSGPAGRGPLSFLIPGMTMGIDFPYRPGVEELVAKLDHLVIEQQGRVYLAKDALLPADRFREMYPRWKEFEAVCDRLDPNRSIQSDQSRRLGLRAPD